MKNAKFIVLALLIASIFLVGTTNKGPLDEKFLFFETELSGAHEVPLVVTILTGEATFRYDKVTGDFLYKVVVQGDRSNPPTVLAAHVHCAIAGQNGPVGYTIYSGPPKTGNGVLATGNLTAPDAGNACGWTTVADVTNAMRTGNAYVNVHTVTFPSGEARGQLSLTP